MSLISVLALLIRHDKNKICRVGILEIWNHGVEGAVKRIGLAVCALSDRAVPKPKIVRAAKDNHKIRCLIHRVHPVHKRAGVGVINDNICNP